MTRRLLAIAVAIVLAALGTAGVLWYTLSANDRARADITDPVTVAVAAKRISPGTSGATIRQQNMVRFEKMPKGVVPTDAMGQIGADYDKLVITSNIEPGQLILAAMFGEQAQVVSGLSLPQDRMAVTVQTGSPQQVAGYVQTGSQVTIFVTYKVLDSKGEETKIVRTRVLLPRVEVLAVGTYTPNSDSGGNATATGGSGEGQLLITVAVNQAEGERLIQGLNLGSLYLGLLTDSIDVKAGSGVDNRDSGDATTPIFR